MSQSLWGSRLSHTATLAGWGSGQHPAIFSLMLVWGFPKASGVGRTAYISAWHVWVSSSYSLADDIYGREQRKEREGGPCSELVSQWRQRTGCGVTCVSGGHKRD